LNKSPIIIFKFKAKDYNPEERYGTILLINALCDDNDGLPLKQQHRKASKTSGNKRSQFSYSTFLCQLDLSFFG